MHARTLYDKLWDSHVVREEGDGTALLYIDRHLVHEVTSPQAYEGLRLAGRKPWRIESIVATADHNTPTTHWDEGIRDPISRTQVETLDANIRDARREGVFPVPRPAPGHRPRDRPGAGRDAARHDGRLRRLAHEHARRVRRAGVRHRHVAKSSTCSRRRCLLLKKAKTMLVRVDGALPPRRARAKDLVLAIIGRIGTAGGTGHAIEFAGSADPRAVDGRPDDGLQHGDRGRRAGRAWSRSTTPRSPTCEAGRSRPTGDVWTRAVEHTGARCVQRCRMRSSTGRTCSTPRRSSRR